jgi:hypothetical protein
VQRRRIVARFCSSLAGQFFSAPPQRRTDTVSHLPLPRNPSARKGAGNKQEFSMFRSFPLCWSQKKKKSSSSSSIQIKRLCKLSSSLVEAQTAIHHLSQSFGDSLAEASFSSSCGELSALLRGLTQCFGPEAQNQQQNHQNQHHPNQHQRRRASVLFFSPPDVMCDSDFHGALGALSVGNIACDLVFFSSDHLSETASQRLGDLAVAVAGYSSVSLSRVRSQHAVEDVARLRSFWHHWAHPPMSAMLRLPGQANLDVSLAPLLVSGPAPTSASTCACHNLLVARPARCSITGRKPTERPALAYSFDGVQFKAGDNGTEASELIVLAAMPASGVDACFVLGGPMHLTASATGSEDFLLALADQLRSRGEALIIKLKSRFQTSMHIASVIDGGSEIVLTRVAAREDVLMANPTVERRPSNAAARASCDLLDALPRPSSYNPLAYSNQIVAHFQTSIAAEQVQQTMGQQNQNHNQQQTAPSALSKKMVRLNLQ